jgi:tetratricopeptide (TPR) repeat protein
MSKMHRIFLLTVLLSVFTIALNAQKKDTLRALDKDQEYYKQGIKLMDSAKYKEAIKLFQKALKENNVFYQAHNKIAVCKVKLNDFKGAEKELEKSLKIQADDAGTLKYLGFVYMEDRKYKEARMYFDSAYKVAKDDYELEYYIANLKMLGNDYKGAITNLDQAIFIKENYGDAWLKRGLAFSKLKNYKYTVRDITRALELNPQDSSNIDAFKARGEASYQLGDFQQAVEDYGRIITVDPKNEDAYIYRGAARIEINDNSGAIDDETKAIELNKNSFMAYNLRGVAKGGLKTYGEAIKDLDQAIKIKMDYAPAYVNRASIKYAMNEKRKACDDLYKADQLGSNIAYKYIESYCRGMEGQK